ncbi:protein NUCLEAR FUSION DEFECTIVE 6, chloroplastic/mitochondrial [Morus notabilis]|uniref:protein NUCLEAR FUSION DEFECTIVE 6, chloroplastic/mitochondrial n=1 Tax=Morus notabilis TaxID=981085 RepID=UPI000CED78DE|nr:protein NUCLEAR FUSION DEFECTIVE 6, chloroplastic/mitochondrial [Morus notabilis]
MAANCVRQTLRVSSASAKILLRSSSSPSLFASKAASKLAGLAASKPSSASRFSLHKLNSSRLPVELASLQSLMPLHSVTASALFTSMLSLHNNKWGCLSEGFATPL